MAIAVPSAATSATAATMHAQIESPLCPSMMDRSTADNWLRIISPRQPDDQASFADANFPQARSPQASATLILPRNGGKLKLRDGLPRQKIALRPRTQTSDSLQPRAGLR